MKITDYRMDASSLVELGSIATQLLCSGDFTGLAAQFGYALAGGREPAVAIREDLALSLSELGASTLCLPLDQPPSVSYFEPNDTGFFALVEQYIPTDRAGQVLLELIVTAHGPDKHVVLEQLSAAA